MQQGSNVIAVVIVAQQTNSVFDFTVLHSGHAAAETVRAEGKNLEWTVKGMAWSLKKLWVESSKPYNQCRFESIGTGNESSKPTNQYRFESIGMGDESSKPYNQYRFESIGTGNESSWD